MKKVISEDNGNPSKKVIGISVLTSYFLFAAINFSIGLILPGLKHEFNLSPIETGGFASAASLMSALTLSLAGYLSDRLGRRITLMLGSTILFTGTYLTSIASSYIAAVISILFSGAGTGFLTTSIYAIMGSLYPKSRGLIIGLTASVYNWAGFLGSFVMGDIIDKLGWRFGFGSLGVTGLIWTALMLFTLRKTSLKLPHVTIADKASYRKMLRSRNTIWLAAAMFCRGISAISFLYWVPAFLTSMLSLDVAQAGMVIGIYSAAGGVSSLLTGLYADYLGEKYLILVTLIASALTSLIFFSLASSLIFAAAIGALIGVGIFPTWNLSTSLGQRITDPRLGGSITGLLQNMALIGGVIGPIAAGAFIDIYPIEWAMIFSVSIPLLIGGLMVAPVKTRVDGGKS